MSTQPQRPSGREGEKPAWTPGSLEANGQCVLTTVDLALYKALRGVVDCADADGGVFIPANGETMKAVRAALSLAHRKAP